MLRKLGISIYPDHSNIEDDKKYLKKAADLGYTRIFTSMLEVSEGKDAVKTKFSEILHYAKTLGFESVLDVAPSSFELLGISWDDLSFFAEVGADAIRLDQGFDGSQEAMLTYNDLGLAVELNESNNVAYLDNILTYQANEPYLWGCHNFYPQENTGLSYEFFVDCSKRFKKAGIRSAAFVTSQTGKLGPWPVTDGLPTLAEHRHLPIDVQAKHLFATNLVDDILIGNAYASDEELETLANLNRYMLEFKVQGIDNNSEVENKIIFDELHFCRGDITPAMIRSTMPRVIYKATPNPAHNNGSEFQKGDIVIGNDDFANYKNELQIVLEPHSDARKNLVGRIPKSELFLLDFVKPWSKLRFCS